MYRQIVIFVLVASLGMVSEAQALELERRPFDSRTIAVQGAAGMLASSSVAVVGFTSLSSSRLSAEGTIIVTLAAIPVVVPIAVGFTGHRRGLGKNQAGAALGSLSGALIGSALAVAAMKSEFEYMLTAIALSVLAAPVVGSIIGYHLQARHSGEFADRHSPQQPWAMSWSMSF